MCIQSGNLVHKILKQNEENYSLQGMISPSFQNLGTATAYIDGRVIAPGKTFSVNVPGIELQNTIQIIFENDPSKVKQLHLHFVQLTKQ